jgi:ribosome-associated heat shock protein Hsp15
MNEEDGRRLDKWLWFARFCKSRTLASKLCAAGKIRIDGELVHKAHHLVRAGDVLTFPQGAHIRVVRVVQLGVRRGPATEARTLYEDLSPPAPREPAVLQREPGAGRPTKVERRALDRLRDQD